MLCVVSQSQRKSICDLVWGPARVCPHGPRPSVTDEGLPATTHFFTHGPVPALLATERLTCPPSCWSLGHLAYCRSSVLWSFWLY